MSRRMAVTVVAVAFGAGAVCAGAQEPRPPGTKVITKTLVKSEAQKECFSLPLTHVLYYRFRSDAPLDFKLSHHDGKEVIDIRRDHVTNGAGSHTSKANADYCLVWSNTGPRSATLHYEFQRGPQ
jgi:hypothetical protein